MHEHHTGRADGERLPGGADGEVDGERLTGCVDDEVSDERLTGRAGDEVSDERLTGRAGDEVDDERHAGRCLCGAVIYELRGPLREVLVCHCVECRRWGGHAAAMTAVPLERLVFVQDRGLRWIDSPQSELHARRGFCAECGSSLFWKAPARETISVAAGTLDGDPGIGTAGHIWTAQAGGYYELPEDGLPRHERGTG